MTRVTLVTLATTLAFYRQNPLQAPFVLLGLVFGSCLSWSVKQTWKKLLFLKQLLTSIAIFGCTTKALTEASGGVLKHLQSLQAEVERNL